MFVDDTPAGLAFDWYADSETLRHGSEPGACAAVTLRREATAAAAVGVDAAEKPRVGAADQLQAAVSFRSPS